MASNTPKDNNALDFAGYAFPVEGLGPGRRVAIWLRGCDRHCAGCISPELWEPGEPTPPAEIAGILAPLLPQSDGLTVSGGEPFYQAEALTALIELLRGHADVEVMVYTGFLLEELAAQGGATAGLLESIDILIDGPFEESAPNTLRWRGSDNQRVHLLTERAQRHAEAANSPMAEPRPLQVQMIGLTRYRIIGIPRRGDMAAYRAAMAARGLEVRPDNG
jgi:anaerobic ribonucleoside-triphosphate reductase activating protein